MKSNKIIRAIGGIDDELIERAAPRNKNKKRIIYRYIGIAACMAVIAILCIMLIPNLFGNPDDTPPSKYPINPDIPLDKSLAGLPVNNFSLGDVQLGVDFAMDRLVFSQLSDFFSYNMPPVFAYVRVVGTELWEDKNSHGSFWQQTSSLYVISELWNQGDALPEIISLTQSLYGGCVLWVENGVLKGSEITHLLREGGVYLLPLGSWEWDGEVRWYLHGDLDVLFEVDDKGLVWSHSRYPDFSRFDGKAAGVLTEAVTAFTSDENFTAATTTFGQIIRHWGVFAEVTVLSEIATVGRWGDDQYHFTLKADDILSVSNVWSPLRPEKGSEIRAVSYIPGYLEKGGRYLVLLDPSEDGPYIDPSRAAKINNDGTITAEDSVFERFNGYTVAQMAEIAERAKAWHDRYVR